MTLAFPRITVRLVAVLMLVAGVSLGVLFARTLQSEAPRPPQAVLDQAIEYKVRLYVETYRLDTRAADLVRRRLVEHDRAVTELYRDLREKNAAAFDQLRGETERVLDDIFKKEVDARAK